MANIIAVIWDCDKTLVDGYMQDPIFEHYGVNSSEFWSEVNELPAYYQAQGVKINRDTIYLNHFIHKAHDGTFPGLNNKKLHSFGKELKFYKGVPEIFEKTKEIINSDSSYAEYGIQVEHYIVSTGMTEIIRGSELMSYISGVWGCELIEGPDKDGNRVISEIGYTIDNTTKTKALFEINKGILQLENVDVNSKIPEDKRRVQFKNMIYIADGPSDIPAFSLVNKNGGSTFGIYPKGDMEAMQQVEQMRADGRINMYAEADYSEGTTAYMWIINKIKKLADAIKESEKAKVQNSVSASPRHLN
ncbi:MAG: haloacid dehalogenase-like hydrolase [Clostridia bacterium]|nr:haloacid dehalogenase-like hydrolase [Clostridia bacterium]